MGRTDPGDAVRRPEATAYHLLTPCIMLAWYKAGMTVKRRPHPIRARDAFAGFTLIEVLVAVLILSVGLLGLSRLQAVGLQAQHQALMRSQATLLVTDIVERLRLNRRVALAGEYDLAASDEAPAGLDCTVRACDETERAASDLAAWRTRIDGLMPVGTRAEVSVVAGRASVRLSWPDPRLGSIIHLGTQVRL
jgi:type IV pilus assembly protein PilV